MAEHTPGPWSWWTSNSLMRLTGAPGHGQRDGGVLCAVRRSDGFADIEVKPEDARLIAMAPDLLVALSDLVKAVDDETQALIEYRHSTTGCTIAQSRVIECVARAHKVIAKATESGNG